MDVASSRDDALTIRAGSRNLHVGREDPLSPARWLGQGGDIMAFRMRDGRVVVSNSLWSAGEIPVRFRALLPDNAERIDLPASVTRQSLVEAILVSQTGGDAAALVGLPVVAPTVGLPALERERVELVADGDGVADAVAAAVIRGAGFAEMADAAEVESDLSVGGGL
jgi:hypothetical protein